jgi:PKD repeat protein
VKKIMQPEDFRHVWILPSSAWWIKVYVWVWNADVADITFCKLFWGYTLIWLGLTIRTVTLVASAVAYLGRGFNNARKSFLQATRAAKALEREKQAALEKVKPPAPPKEVVFRLHARGTIVNRVTKIEIPKGLWNKHKYHYTNWDFGDGTGRAAADVTVSKLEHTYTEPGRYEITVKFARPSYSDFNMEQVIDELKLTVNIRATPVAMKMLEATGNGFSAALMKTSSAAHTVKTTAKAVSAATPDQVKEVAATGGRMGVVLTAVAGFGSLLFLGVTGILSHWHQWTPTMLTVGRDAEYAIPVLVFLMLVAGVVAAALRWGFFYAFRRGVAEPVIGAGRKAGMGFGQMMLIGYKSVKSNTCPRVVVKEDVDA